MRPSAQLISETVPSIARTEQPDHGDELACGSEVWWVTLDASFVSRAAVAPPHAEASEPRSVITASELAHEVPRSCIDAMLSTAGDLRQRVSVGDRVARARGEGHNSVMRSGSRRVVRGCLVSSVLALTACSGEAPSAPPTTHASLGPSGSGTGPSPTPLPQPGGCENLHVDATCTFASIDPVDPSTGAPAQAGSSPEAEQTYAIVYRLEPGAAVSEAALHVRASVRDEAALRAHYEANVSARCSGEVLRAPCPPGVHVVPAVPAPPIGQLVHVP